MQDLRARRRARRARPAPRRPLGGRRVGRAPRRRAGHRQSARRDRARRAAPASRRRAQLLARRGRCSDASTTTSGSAFAFATARSRCSSAPATGRRSAIRERWSSPPSASSPRVDEADLGTFCAKPCRAGSTTCPPRQQVRSFAISVAGRSAIDPLVTRALRSSRSRSQRHRRRQLRGMSAMSHRSPIARSPVASLARRPARRRRPLRHRHALLRHGPRGRRRASQRRRRGAASANELRSAAAPSRPPKPASNGRSRASTIRPGSAPIACRAPTRRRSRFASAWLAHRRRRSGDRRAAHLDGRRHARCRCRPPACAAPRLDLQLPGGGRPELPASAGSAMAPAFIVELARVDTARRRSRRLRPAARAAGAGATCAASIDRPAKRRRGSKPRGRCCRRCAPRRPPR